MIKHSSVALFLIYIFSLSSSSLAQENYTVSGTMKNSETGEALIGGAIIVKELSGVGALSNAYGFYSLTLPEGRYTFQIQFMGFKTQIDSMTLQQNRVINFALEPEPVRMNDVLVSGERLNANVTSTDVSATKLEMKQVESIPVLLGEKDILKTIQLLPGIKSAGEGSTGFYSRGGGVDQNLIILDEAPVYNPSHLLGYLSVFNADAIKDVSVVTGGMPAEYGGRLSSVVDIRTNDGNTKEFGGAGGIGLLDSRLMVNGPIVADQGSYIVTARRSYADLFLHLSRDTTINQTSMYFYDLNMKANYILGDQDRLFLSGYFGRDNFAYTNVFGFNWGNSTATLRWNHIFGGHLFSNTSFIFSDYEYTNAISSGTSQFQITSGIRDLNFKEDFQYVTGSQSTLKFGMNSIYHTFVPGSITGGNPSNLINVDLEHRFALENGIYFSHELNLFSKLKLNYGLRFSTFSLLGPGHIYSYDSSGTAIDTSVYGSGSIVKTFAGLEPRLSLTYILDESSSLKTSYTRTTQYLHLLSSSTQTNPSDLWVPSSNNVPPQYADQVDLGYFRNFDDNAFETSLQVYYKNMQNVIDYKNGADLQRNPNVEALLLYGRGWSYGTELLVRKRYGTLSGWIGYTLSRTEEQFPLINDGQPFPATQDRTHDVSVVVIYNYSDTWTFSATWVYNTGNAVTFPNGDYQDYFDQRKIPYYTNRNGYRMPAYHRLDLSATWTLGPHSNLNFSIYNAYDRMNAYSIIFRQNPDDPSQNQAVQTTIFPIIPSVTYNFTF
ncbi:MAG TPA: TonB-dependent receptor [Bacteroidota bacterium]|nr:TonB-dependent receptor [Bacteroidota bacterium]